MANAQSYVTGKSINNILNIPIKELEQMSTSQLKKVVGRGVSAGNKRIRRFLDARGRLPLAGRPKGVETYEDMKFSAQGKDKTELLEEFKRLRNFYNSEMSSLTEFKKVQKKVINELKKQTGIEINNVDYDRFWDLYEELRKEYPEIGNENFHYLALNDIREKIGDDGQNFDFEKVLEELKNQFDEKYRERQRVVNGVNGTSGLFKIQHK